MAEREEGLVVTWKELLAITVAIAALLGLIFMMPGCATITCAAFGCPDNSPGQCKAYRPVYWDCAAEPTGSQCRAMNRGVFAPERCCEADMGDNPCAR